MAEIWELVDINENKTGILIERGSNTPIPDGMFHMAVDIWTINKSGKILLTQRHPNKDCGLLWECSGGAIVKGETPLEGARRELFEETGIVVPEEDIRYLGRTVGAGFPTIMHTYFVCVEDDVKLKLQAEEVVDAKWVEVSELEDLKNEIVPYLWKRWEKYKDLI